MNIETLYALHSTTTNKHDLCTDILLVTHCKKDVLCFVTPHCIISDLIQQHAIVLTRKVLYF